MLTNGTNGTLPLSSDVPSWSSAGTHIVHSPTVHSSRPKKSPYSNMQSFRRVASVKSEAKIKLLYATTLVDKVSDVRNGYSAKNSDVLATSTSAASSSIDSQMSTLTSLSHSDNSLIYTSPNKSKSHAVSSRVKSVNQFPSTDSIVMKDSTLPVLDIIKSQQKNDQPKRLQNPSTVMNSSLNGDYVRRMAAKNATACVNAMLGSQRNRNKTSKHSSSSSMISLQTSTDRLQTDNTANPQQGTHLSGVLGKRKPAGQPGNYRYSNSKKKNQEQITETGRVPPLSKLAQSINSKETPVHSSSSSSSSTSFTDSELECTESLPSSTDESTSDTSICIDEIPYNCLGLLYNGDCIHPKTRFFFPKEGSAANKIIPVAVPSMMLSLPDLVSKALHQAEKKTKQRSMKGDNSWVAIGDPIKRITIRLGGGTMAKVQRKYFTGIKRRQEKVFVRDCILVKSGKRKDDKPYVAKVASIWQESAGLMMTVFWYYRTDDVDSVIASQFCEMELLASQHHDDIGVACIDGKCKVLGLTQFCRIKAAIESSSQLSVPRTSIVPKQTFTTNLLTNDPKSKEKDLLLESDVYLCYRAYNHIIGKIIRARSYK